MYLSFSGFSVLGECPKKYWHQYVDKTTLPKPDNCINALYGSTVGTLFEDFYEKKLWKRPDVEKYMLSEVEPTLDKVIEKERKSNKLVDWADEKANYHSRSDLVEEIRAGVPRGLTIIRQNRFLGPVAKAEMKLDHDFGPHRVAGRADFVIQRVDPYGDLIILDGKGSKHREKYVKETQLKWYALLYYTKTGKLPDRLGFLFWRFDGDKAVLWVDFTKADIHFLKEEVLGTMTRVEKNVRRLEILSQTPKAHYEERQELFPAQPTFGCKLCSYLPVCEEGLKKYGPKQKSEGGGGRRSKVTVLPGSGVRELSLDDD